MLFMAISLIPFGMMRQACDLRVCVLLNVKRPACMLLLLGPLSGPVCQLQDTAGGIHE